MKFDKSKSIFLLGGQDLEMVTIRELLKKYEIAYIDKNLFWENANLSAYRDEIEKNNNKTFYAVELNIDEDDGFYKKYKEQLKIIDHHGDAYNHKKASLLQMLDLLNLAPTRDQELIAANDAQYIEGMKCMGATDEEIVDIRQRDREAQGINYLDEIVGKNDAKNKKIINGIAIVYATTPYFSTITDSLYLDFEPKERQSKTIIYNDSKIVFYGFYVEKLKKLCNKYKLGTSGYYHGGGDYGYFGVKEGEVMAEKRDAIVKELSEEKENTLYSSHTFMFPFRFDFAKKNLKVGNKTTHEYAFYYDDSIDDRINLEALNRKLKEEGWHYEPYKISGKDKHLLYNEFAYFYDYARDSLYNRDEFPKDAISSFYIKKIDGKNVYENKTFCIDILKIGKTEAITYELTIKEVSLRIFHTGVAILSIELDNTTHEKYEDILRINDFGRRVYPQYIGQKDNECTTKHSFLPNYIKIGDDDKEYFNHFNYEDVPIGRHIMQVLGENIFTANKEETKEKFYIQPSLDDRMFVLSWYGNDAISKELSTCSNYKESDKWYKYLFIDGGNDATVQNEMMKKNLLAEATYDRWSGYDTFYGITRYSFVLLSPTLSSLKKNNADMIVKHMKTMYFQMATLLLANRTSILRFSDEIAALVSPTKKQKEKTSIEEHAQKLEDLYDKYLTYYNRLYFKEVTHQDQGIELYDIGIKQMRIGEHVDKLDSKFEKLFNFMNLKAEKVSSERMDNLTKLGAVFLPPSLTVALLSMGIFDYDKSYRSLLIGLGAIGLSVVLGYWAFIKKEKESKDEK